MDSSTAEQQQLSAKDRVRFLIIPYALLVAVKIVLAWGLDTPIKVDEFGYLGNARYLATGEGLTDSLGRHAYKVGYSLLLVPAFLIENDSIGGFKVAQLINALLLSLIYPAAFLLVGKLRPGLPAVDRMLLGLCAASYPSASLYATAAMSANVFMPAYFLFLLAAFQALANPRWWWWAGLACTTVFLYAVHERAIGILVFTLVVVTSYLLWEGSRRIYALGFLGAAAGAMWLLRLVEVEGSRWHTGTQVTKVFQGAIADPGRILVTVAGHLEYLGFSTFAVLFVGIFYLLLERRAPSTEWAVPKFFWIVLYGSAASIFAISVLFNVVRWPEVRFTQWVYGRHNEMVLLPMLLVSVLALRTVDRGGEQRKLFLKSCVGAAIFLSALAGILWFFWTPEVGRPHSFCATSVAVYMQVWEAVGEVVMAAAMALGAVLLAAAFATRWRTGILALIACFVLSSTVTYFDGWRKRYAQREEQRELIRLVRRIEEVHPPSRRVILNSVKEEKAYHYHYYSDTYFLPDYSFRPLGKRAKKSPPGELVLSGNLKFNRGHRGARMVGLEDFSSRTMAYIQSLWVLRGPLQDALAQRNWLFPENFPHRFEEAYLRSELRLLEPQVESIKADEERSISVEVVHRGEGPWPHRGGLVKASSLSGKYSVGLRGTWFKEGATEPVAQRWEDLPKVIYPGESTIVSLHLPTGPKAQSQLSAGTYRLVLEIAQDLREKPGPAGAGALELMIEVE